MSTLNLTRRGHMNGNRSGGSSSKEKSNKKNKAAGDIITLERWIELAEYEAVVDPYRGMMTLCSPTPSTGTALGSLVTKNACPWYACHSDVLSGRKNHKKNMLSSKSATMAVSTTKEEDAIDPVVRQVKRTCNCTCPSLVHWTNQAHKDSQRRKSRKGNKRRRTEEVNQALPCFGQRPDDTSLRCACDYNPFCWVSVGGVVNTILTEAAIEAEQEEVQEERKRERENIQLQLAIETEQNAKRGEREKEESGREKDKANDRAREEGRVRKMKDGKESGSIANKLEKERENLNETEKVTKQKKGEENDVAEVMSQSELVIDLESEVEGEGNNCASLLQRELHLKSYSQRSQSLQSSSLQSIAARKENPIKLDFDEMELDPNKDECIYSKETVSQLKTVRKAAVIHAQPIRSYLKDLYQASSPAFQNHKNNGSKDDAFIDQLVQNLIKYHRSLAFVNPLLPEEDENNADSSLVVLPSSTDRNESNNNQINNSMLMSIPPGILNLGATCYLNTQLQCLAQNMVFLKGIFSWRPVPVGVHQNNHKNNNNVMDSVLSKLQLLLAQMVRGHYNYIDTIEFSKSLGLVHDEQQDPNEFARLLFERMHDAFQQMTTPKTTTNPMKDLSTLLPRIFEGSTIYETTCFTCQTTSVRNEAFMDLNLPIVRPSDDNDKESLSISSIPKKIMDFIMGVNKNNKDVDTNLQYCLDKYECEEVLNSDNQYFCDKCNCKRDAKRLTKLGKLPPVLNIQLSRYVFDRQKFVKKKLTDKVLLPHILYLNTTTPPAPAVVLGNSNHNAVDTKEKISSSRNRTKEYKLCAVMKHIGSTAYRGHYVAEVMDWSSGQWFEFNDDKVTLLKSGPSCSYFPAADVKVTKNSYRGSPDAYNMYYVEKSFLAKCVLDNLCGYENEKDTHFYSNTGLLAEEVEEQRHDVLYTVGRKREEIYRQLTNMCFADRQLAEQLRARRDRIRKELFTAYSQIDLFREADAAAVTNAVWVDADQLRKFISCKKGQTVTYVSYGDEPLLRHKHLLCHHSKPGLHPRIARRGKLLPLPVYNAFISILLSENMLVLNQNNTSNNIAAFAAAAAAADAEGTTNINDCVITPTKGLFCEECSASYRKELSQKLYLIKTLKSLHEGLDPKNDITIDSSIRKKLADDGGDYGGGSDDDDDDGDQYAYAVARKSLTAFRGMITSLLKKVSAADVTSNLLNCDNAGTNTCNELESYAEGLDAIDLSEFNFEKTINNLDKKCAKLDKDRLDYQLNNCITCEHGNCNVINNKRLVRYVSAKVWTSLKKVFPHAIEHRKTLKRSCFENADDAGIDCNSENRSNDNQSLYDEDLCPICQKAEQEVAQLEEQLEKWGMLALSRANSALLDLYDKKSNEKMRKNNENALKNCASVNGKKKSKFWLVHKDDIAAWREAVTVVTSKKKHDIACLRGQLEQILLQSAAPDLVKKNDVDNQDNSMELSDENIKRRRSQMLSGAVTALTCKEHSLTIDTAIFQDGTNMDESSNDKSENAVGEKCGVREIADRIEILNDVQYGAFKDSLTEIVSILIPSDDSKNTHKKEEGDDIGMVMNLHDRLKHDEQSSLHIDLTQDEQVVPSSLSTATLKLQHPSIHALSEGAIAGTDKTTFSLRFKDDEDQLPLDFGLYPRVCCDWKCSSRFAEEQKLRNENGMNTRVRQSGNISTGEKQIDVSNEKNNISNFISKNKDSTTNLGSVAEDPILVESDTEDNYNKHRKSTTKYPIFDLRVFEIEASACISDVLTDLSEGCSTLQLKSNNESSSFLPSITNTLRRSTRKRKVRYPVGKILGEDCIQVGLHHNLAALRLFLYEKCETPPDQKLTLVAVVPPLPLSTVGGSNACKHGNQSIPIVGVNHDKKENESLPTVNSKVEQRTVNLPFDLNHELLQKKYEQLFGSPYSGSDSAEETTEKNPWSSTILLRQSNENDESFKGKTDTLLHSLLEITNSLADSAESNEKTSKSSGVITKKSRRFERGFKGTLLHQSLNTITSITGEASSPNGDFVDKENAMKNQEEKNETSSKSSNDTAIQGGDDSTIRKCDLQDQQQTQLSRNNNESLAATRKHDLNEKKSKSLKNSSKVVIMSDTSSDDEQLIYDASGAPLVVSVEGACVNTDNAEVGLHTEILPIEHKMSLAKKQKALSSVQQSSQKRTKRARSSTDSTNCSKQVKGLNGNANNNITSRQKITTQVVNFLMECENFGTLDEKKCLEAAKWAEKSNPLISCIEQLADFAVCRYFDVLQD